MADSSENSLCATTIRHSYENRPRPTVFVGAGFKPASQYQRHPHTVIPAESLPRTPIRGRNPVPGHLPCEDGQADPFSSSGCRRQSAWPIPLKIACVPPPGRHSYENRPRPTVFVGAGFKPASQYQRHPHTVIPAESLPRTPIRGRNPVPGHLPCEDGQADPFSSSRVSATIAMADSSENSLCATTIRHSYENRPRPTVFVGAGFKPAPQYQRHPHTVIPAKASIHPPSISPVTTQRPPTLSFQVVRVATLMTYSERILPHLSFRTQRSEVRNLKSSLHRTRSIPNTLYSLPPSAPSAANPDPEPSTQNPAPFSYNV